MKKAIEIGLTKIEQDAFKELRALVKDQCIDELRAVAKIVLETMPGIDIEQFIKLSKTIVEESADQIASHRFLYSLKLKNVINMLYDGTQMIKIDPCEVKH